MGEYAQSCLGRERVVEFVSREQNLRALIYRLNYAVDLRYGTLVDIARKVLDGEAIDLTMGFFNAIWQGDANSYALRSLELCASPPAILNVTGPERISVRETAEWFGSTFGRPPRFVNSEGPVALLSDSSRCRALLGEPAVPLPVLRQWVAHWVRAGGASLGQTDPFRSDRWPVLRSRDVSTLRRELLRGLVIPAHPLALTETRTLDERRQVALTRYYCDAGAGGIAVGVHTTQFAIRDPAVGLFEPVLRLAQRPSRDWCALLKLGDSARHSGRSWSRAWSGKRHRRCARRRSRSRSDTMRPC